MRSTPQWPESKMSWPPRLMPISAVGQLRPTSSDLSRFHNGRWLDSRYAIGREGELRCGGRRVGWRALGTSQLHRSPGKQTLDGRYPCHPPTGGPLHDPPLDSWDGPDTTAS